ncbi:MAG: phenylacetate--CoA ligase family protein, partial [Candidatus Competibacterales bacterium]
PPAPPPPRAAPAPPAAPLDSLFVSPGPLVEPGSLESSYWRLARALYATGFRQGQVIHNAFSYHATPGGWIFHAGARALGCPVIPAGTAPMELQLQLLSAYRPVGFAGVPDFLAALVKAAQEAGIPLPLERGLVSGGALTAAHLEGFAQAGLAVLQCYATAEVGLIAYETRSGQGLVVDEGVIVEIIDPQTDQPAAAGQVGEVVVTLLRRDYPLIRFATGDLSAVIPGPSPCGRTNLRLKGWLGRADQAAKVRGLFVRPSQIHALVQRQGAVQRARLIISRPGERDEMALRCEVASQGADPSSLAEAIAADLRALTQLRGEVVLMAPGELPDDGVLIEDTRR